MLTNIVSFSLFFYISKGEIKTGKGLSEMLDFLEFVIEYSIQGEGSQKKT